MSNIISYILCFGWLPIFLWGLLWLAVGYWLRGLFTSGSKESVAMHEAEGRLKAEATSLRGRVSDLEGRLKSDVAERDAKIKDLERRMKADVSSHNAEMKSMKAQAKAEASGSAGAAMAAGAVAAASGAAASSDDTYALEWRNRYLAARVKYLEGRLTELPKTVKAKAVKKQAAVKKKVEVKKQARAEKKAEVKQKVAAKKPAPATRKPAVKRIKPAAKPTVKKATPAKKAAKAPARKAAPKPKAKAKPKATPKPKVLYTDGPTDGKPDDLKRIRGIGPKFEKDLNNKGIYYFRQIGNWVKKDVNMVEDLIDSIPGRIERDQWVKQAKGFASGIVPKESIMKSAKTSSGSADKNAKYYKDVAKFDARADKAVIDKIVSYCGIALRTRDGSLIACSDKAEIDRVAAGFCVKKLGLTKAQGGDLANQICQDMKSSRFKNRVTFYYLAAKKAGKLSVFK